MVLKVFLVAYMLIDMIPPQRWHTSTTTKTQKLACSGDFFEQLKSGHKQNQKLEPKIPPHFFSGFFWEPKKTQKVAKMQLCNFATLQLFHVVVFFNCFLIKKGKKVQKLQSCILQLFGFFWPQKKNLTKKKIHQKKWNSNLRSLDSRNLLPIFLVMPSSQKFAFEKPVSLSLWGAFISKAYILGACSFSFLCGKKISQVSIPGTFPLNFLWEKNLTSFHSKNLLPKFLWEKNLTSFHSKNLLPNFFVGKNLTSFHSKNLLPNFFVGKKSHKLPFQEPSP